MATGFWPISISIWVCLIFSVRSQLQCVLKSGFHWEFTSMNPWIPRSEPAILTGDQFTCYQYPRYTWDIPPTKKGVQTWGLTVHRDENRESRDDPGSNKTCVALSLNSFNWLKKENEWYIYIYIRVGGLEPCFFYVSIQLGIIIPTDELIFFRGVETTNQICNQPVSGVVIPWPCLLGPITAANRKRHFQHLGLFEHVHRGEPSHHWRFLIVFPRNNLGDTTFPDCIYQWIGLRENLQETIDFPMKYGAFL